MSDGCLFASASQGKMYNLFGGGIFMEYTGFGSFIVDIDAVSADICFVADANNWSVKRINKSIIEIAKSFVDDDKPVYLSKIDENSFWAKSKLYKALFYFLLLILF